MGRLRCRWVGRCYPFWHANLSCSRPAANASKLALLWHSPDCFYRKLKKPVFDAAMANIDQVSTASRKRAPRGWIILGLAAGSWILVALLVTGASQAFMAVAERLG